MKTLLLFCRSNNVLLLLLFKNDEIETKEILETNSNFETSKKDNDKVTS